MSLPTDSLSIAEQFFSIGMKAAEKLIEQIPIFYARDDNEFAHEGAMMCFFAKGYKSYQAIRALWKQGFPEDAVTLSRSLFELTLQASWVHRSRPPRARQFLEHERVAQYLHYERLKKMGNDPDLVGALEKRKDDLDRLKADFNRLKSTYAKGKKGKGFHEHWWNGRIVNLVEWLGPDWQKQYNRLYWMMSGYVHSDAHSYSAYLNKDPRGWLVNCRPSEPVGLGLLMPRLATGWLLEIASMMDSTYGTGLDVFFTELRDEFLLLVGKAEVPAA
jgi:Family of unknown function (DUF5677)